MSDDEQRRCAELQQKLDELRQRVLTALVLLKEGEQAAAEEWLIMCLQNNMAQSLLKTRKKS